MFLRLSFLAALTVAFATVGFGQAHLCGSHPTPAQIEVMNAMRDARAGFTRSNNVVYLPVHHHIVRQSNGVSLVTNSDLPGLMDELNGYFAESNVQFFTCGPTNYINSSSYYDFHQDQEDALCEANDIENVINMYYVNTITKTDGSTIGGYAYFPGSHDRIFIANSNVFNGTTVTHEMGHYLSLYHTHSTSNGVEYVNGSNCEYAGDQLCDTPADPNLLSQVDYYCNYTGNDVDPNGQFYDPDPTNIMSYSNSSCRDYLSPGQLDRAQFSALYQRSYLTCYEIGCTDAAACNYEEDNTIDDGSCDFTTCLGCIDAQACNFDYFASQDDGSCEYASCGGCTEVGFCNYDPEATYNDGSCNNNCLYCKEGTHWDNEVGACVVSVLFDVNGDACVQLGDLLSFLAAYGGCLTIEAPACVTADDPCQACGEGTVWSDEAEGCVVASASDADWDGCVSLGDLLSFLTRYGLCEVLGTFECGQTLLFEGHTYATVEYAGNCWLAENLRYLPFISNETATSNSNPRVYVNGYSGSSIEEAQQMDTYDMYGAYYNYATISTMDICPTGWRVPNSATFNRIFSGVEPYYTAGGSMKTSGTVEEGTGLWHSPNTGGDNSLQFNAIPAGYIGYYTGGVEMGYTARFWLDNDDWQNATYYSNRWLLHDSEEIQYYGTTAGYGFSVRCVEDIPGCNDSQACNYLETATSNDGSCYYPEGIPGQACDDQNPNSVNDQWDYTGCNCVGWESNVDPTGAGPCGGMQTVDHEGYTYRLVEIGNQCWFQENVRYLPAVFTSSDASSSAPRAYVHGYEGTSVPTAQQSYNYDTYGVLYNHTALTLWDVCPTGFHPPTDLDWQEVEFELGMPVTDLNNTNWLRGDGEMNDMKDNIHWDGLGADNMLGLRPGGGMWSGSFNALGSYGYYWALGNYHYRSMQTGLDAVFRSDGYHNSTGFSLRCVGD